MMHIDQLTFRVSEAARITELPVKTVRAWLDRHSLFPEMRDIGTGHPVQFRIPHLLMLGAVDALSNTGLTVTAACDIVRNSGAWPFGFDAQWLYATKNEDGRWVGMASPNSEVTIVCNLATTWSRIFPEIVKIIHERAADGDIEPLMASHLAYEIEIASALAIDDHDALAAIARDESRPSAIRDMAAEQCAALLEVKNGG